MSDEHTITKHERNDEFQFTAEDEQLLYALDRSFLALGEATSEDDDDSTERVERRLRDFLEDIQRTEELELKLTLMQRSHQGAIRTTNATSQECLTLELGELSNEFSASQAWLYICSDEQGEQVLRAIATHRTSQRGRKVVVTENTPGIVAEVARTGTPYLARDVKTDAHYVKCNPETVSELAVPIFDSTGVRLLGILNLESSQHVFTEEDCQQLDISAKRLAVGLLCLNYNGAEGARHWPWSPAHGKWTTAVTAQQVCLAVVRAMGLAESADSCSAIAWYADWSKETLRVFGTTYYDAMYIATQCLPMQSYTGAVAREGRGSITISGPEDSRFLMQHQAEAAGLRRTVSIPLYCRTQRTAPGEDRAWGVFHVYFFWDDGVQIMPRREDFAHFGFIIEEWMSDLELLRSECVCSYVRWKLEDRRRQWHLLFNSDQSTMLRSWQWSDLKDVLADVLDADGCSIFTPNDDGSRLLLVTSTGIGLTPAYSEAQLVLRDPDNAFPTWHSLGNSEDEDFGVLSYLCENPDSGVIRINSLLDFEAGKENGIHEDVPRRIVRRHMEPLPGGDENRRFMAFALKGQNGTEIVVRLVRSMRKAPFTEDDAQLFERIMTLCKRNEFFAEVTHEVANAR